MRTPVLWLLLAGCTSSAPRNDVPDARPEPLATQETEPGTASPPDPSSPPDTPPEPPPDAQIVPGADACTSDADCVAAACCHPSACVARSKAPACSGLMCTMNCQKGTMDCGGRCLCQAGKCAALVVQ